MLVFHHTTDFSAWYLTCLSSEGLPYVARVESDPEFFAKFSRQKRNFESQVRSNFLKRSKMDLAREASVAEKEREKEGSVASNPALEKSASRYINCHSFQVFIYYYSGRI